MFELRKTEYVKVTAEQYISAKLEDAMWLIRLVAYYFDTGNIKDPELGIKVKVAQDAVKACQDHIASRTEGK